MLTLEMKELIFLLKEVSYTQGYAEREQSLSESSRQLVRELLERLPESELLRVVTSCPSDSLLSRYELSRPLQEITLCDILRATGGFLELPPMDLSRLQSDQYGLAGRRLDVLGGMIRRALSEISVADIILREDEVKGRSQQ